MENMSDQQIRCAHVAPSISREASGPSRSIVRLCESVQDAGGAIELNVLDWPPLASPPDFLKAHKLGIGPSRLGRSPNMMKSLRVSAICNRVQVIHSHILWQMNSIYPSRAVKDTNVSLITSPRGSLSKWAMQSGSKAKWIMWPLYQKKALKIANCIHATCEEEYADIRRLGFHQPVCILPNGVDLPDASMIKTEREQSVLYFGRLHPVKGIDRLLKAWAKLETSFQNWRLKIAGPDKGYHGGTKYSDELRRLAGDLNLKNVDFIGPQYGDAKFVTYGGASIYVLPTNSENFGLTVAEALASGTPAIVTKGAPWQGLESNKAGWWIDIGVEPLFKSLEKAMSLSSQELQSMGMNGRHWMEMDFGWKGIGQRMLETYQWLCNNGENPQHVRMN